MKLNDTVVLITGAGRGIGRAMAEQFAAEGAAVALLSRTTAQLDEVAAGIKAAGGRALPVAADVVNREQVREAVARTAQEFGPVDVLVNNAGSFDCIGPISEIDAETWWRDCEINLRGPLLTCQAVLPSMIERGRGLIINVIGGGTGNPFPYGSGYASSKAGLMRLTECLAGEVKDHGISVFALGPGFVRTAMTEYQAESEAGRKWIPSSAAGLARGQTVPPDLAAALTVKMAQESDALHPLTGRLLSVGDDVNNIIAQADDIIAQNRRTLRFC
ncbi:MAG TPA: SDR family oxidoreductase [Abditibacteriaceae bacterium]|nr:SDR family oxidoreductase [Abditibacteriaceae bacterium]